MSKKHYKAHPNRCNSLEFLIFNLIFPKSIAYNLSVVQQSIQHIAFHKQKGKRSIDFAAGKLASQFLTIEEVEEDITEFLEETLNKINHIAKILEEKYHSRLRLVWLGPN